MKKIDAYAFNSCYTLSDINLENVSEIADGAFQSTACNMDALLAGSSASVSDTAFFNAAGTAQTEAE